MKRVLFGIFLGVCLFFIPVTAFAEEDYLSEFQSLLPEGVILPEGDEAPSIGVEAFFEEVFALISGSRGEIFSFLLFALGITFLSAVGGVLPDGAKEYTRFGIDVVCEVLLFSKLSHLLTDVVSTLTDASALFRGMIPILVAIHSAGGYVFSAGGGALTGALVFEVINTLTVGILPALIGGLFALGLFSTVAPEKNGVCTLTSSVAGTGKKILGWLTLLFSFALGIQTAIGSAQDTLSLRAMKYAVSSAIPIVGNAVSGALSSLLSSLSYMKTVIGIYGVFALALTVLPVLLRLLLYRVILGFCQWLSAFFGNRCRAVEATAAPLDLLCATLSFSSFLLLFETVLCMMAGTGA